MLTILFAEGNWLESVIFSVFTQWNDDVFLKMKLKWSQDSPSAWQQEVYRPWRILSTACCVWGWGTLSWSWREGGGTHVLVLTRISHPPLLPIPARTEAPLPPSPPYSPPPSQDQDRLGYVFSRVDGQT